MSRIDRKDEVQISKFALTEKQRELRDALAKRGSQSKPVKRVVHAKVVESRASSVSEEGNKNNNMDMDDGGGSARGTVGNVESITAAVAASAAVAATQPFLKLQQELEAKMQTLLAEMDRIQKGASTGATAESQNVTNTGTRRMEYLEQQVQELTERRLQHLETLQNQQMEMQAHLLSMSRGMSQQQARYPSNMPSTTYPTAINLGTSRQQPYSRPFIEHQLAQGRMFGEQGGVEKQAGGCQHDDGGPKGSLLDTPAPREKPPRPVEYGGSKGSGLLHEILAAEPSPQLNTTFSLPPGHTPPVKLGRSRRQDGGSPVDKARKLVHDLSTLEDQTAESIWNDPKKTARYRLPADEPAPLEFYLKRVRDPNSTPYSKLVKTKREESSSVSRSSGKTSRDAPVVNKFEDAHTVLRSIVAKRQTLENNLDLLLRSRQDVDVYTLLGVAGAGSNSSEMNHIRKMVEKRISSLRDEVKREVEWDSRHAVTKGTQPNSYQESRKGTRGTAGKPVVGFGSGAPRMSKIDSGLGKTQPLSDTITQPTKGKRLVKSRPAPKKSKIPYNDEAVMTKIYGKAQYQKGRTTMRDPYLHYQNQAKPRASRIPSPKRVDSTMDVKSSKTQTMGGVGGQLYDDGTTAGGPRQFYFTPNTGYVPLTSSAPAPVAGQLIPVAVPLGKPRMEPGLAVGRETLPHSLPPTSSAPIRPVVTAATNVAMVAMTEGGEVQAERVPELGKQVLPTVDIDSMSPTSSPRGSDIQINKPDTSRNAGYTQTFHFQDSEDEGEMDKTLTEYDSDEEQQGTGISLPGYHPPRPAQDAARPHSPDRAPHNVRFQGSKPQLRDEGRVPWEERCDELAEDLRTRDILQNRAKYWLEQELMARMLIQMYPTFSAQAEQQVDQADADKSESIPDDESLLVGDTIGREGLQLFVDAGQPVDNKLVNALVREVIAERVGGMLGRGREADAASASRAAGSAATATTHGRGAAADVEMEPEFVRPSRQPERVPTPQPTPRTSPIPGYISQHTAPTTPPLTPPSSPKEQRKREEMREVVAPVEVQMASQAQQAVVESDTEASASLDISEELRALDEKLKPRQTFAAALLQSQPQFRHDVVTPTTTPPPSPPPQPAERPRERTPTPSPPPHQPAVEPVQPPAPPPPPQLAPPSPKKEDVQAKSPQPWGNPDSPVPELNPNYEEPEDLQHTQPKPLMMSKAVGTGPQMEERRSPSPQRQRTTSTDQSELDSVSTSSSPSDTFNDNISEGQWLVSRSEGQVAGLPLDEGVHRLAMEAARKVDVSTASTLRDTDDIDLDDTDVSRSEGEFRHKGDGNPETDPVLALMLQMQRQPGGFRQYDLPAERVQHVLNITGRSVGEVTRNGQGSPTRKSMGEMSEGQVLPGNRVTVVTPKVVEQQHDVERRAYQPQQQVTRDDQGRHENRAGRSSPSDHRAANKHRSKSPSLNARGRQLQYQPVSSGLPPAKSQSRQPLKSALVKSGSEEFRHSRDSDPDRRGPATEYGTRTLTPDQLNTDALLRSGSYINASRSMNSTALITCLTLGDHLA
nr:hypothetical protein BaRGS_029067 [Batillaria attramentaria]